MVHFPDTIDCVQILILLFVSHVLWKTLCKRKAQPEAQLGDSARQVIISKGRFFWFVEGWGALYQRDGSFGLWKEGVLKIYQRDGSFGLWKEGVL